MPPISSRLRARPRPARRLRTRRERRRRDPRRLLRHDLEPVEQLQREADLPARPLHLRVGRPRRLGRRRRDQLVGHVLLRRHAALRRRDVRNDARHEQVLRVQLQQPAPAGIECLERDVHVHLREQQGGREPLLLPRGAPHLGQRAPRDLRQLRQPDRLRLGHHDGYDHDVAPDPHDDGRRERPAHPRDRLGSERASRWTSTRAR